MTHSIKCQEQQETLSLHLHMPTYLGKKCEEKYVYTYPLQPILWIRFIDHIFFIWPHRGDTLLQCINHLNTVHSTIKFTKEISFTEIPFLDLMI